MTLVVLFKGKHACHQLLPTTVPVMMEPARWPLGLGRLHKSPTAAAFVLSCLWLTSEHVCACDTDTEPAAYRRGPASSGRLQIAAVANPPPPQSTERRERETSATAALRSRRGIRRRVAHFPLSSACSLTCSSFVLAPSIPSFHFHPSPHHSARCCRLRTIRVCASRD